MSSNLYLLDRIHLNIMKYLILPLSLFVMALTTSCEPASTPHDPHTYQVKRFDGSVTIDGKDSDPAWKQAVLLDTFVFPWQDRPAPHTEFRALWNDNYFFFQFKVVDEDVVMHEDTTRDLSVLGSDRVELFFATDTSLNPYYSLEMDPRAWVFSSKGEHYRRIDPSWSWPGLQTLATVTDDGYILEGSIPMASFSDLNLWQDEANRKLHCGVFRAEFEHQDDGTVKHNWISWIIPQTPKPDFHTPSAFGWLELVD